MISNALKCVGGWGSAPHPAGKLTALPKSPYREVKPSHYKFLATPLHDIVPLINALLKLLKYDGYKWDWKSSWERYMIRQSEVKADPKFKGRSKAVYMYDVTDNTISIGAKTYRYIGL